MTVRVEFSVTSETKLGDYAYIAGNISHLGSWRIESALKLNTNKEIYPQWKTLSPIQIATNIPLEFKLLIKSKEGQVVRWEEIEGNRTVMPTQSLQIIFQQGKKQIVFEKTMGNVQSDDELQLDNDSPKKRRGTTEIINDLSDYSESSSGNQKEFWNQKIYKSSKQLDMTQQFLIHSKITTDSWLRQVNPKHKFRSEKIIKTQPRQILIEKTSHKEEKRLARSQVTKQKIPSKMNIIDGYSNVEEINYDRKETLIQKLMDTYHELTKKINSLQRKSSKQSEGVSIYHIRGSNSTKQLVETIINKLHRFIVIYILGEEDLCVVEAEAHPHLFVITCLDQLKRALQHYETKGWKISALKENKFLLQLGQEFLIVIFSRQSEQIYGFLKDNSHTLSQIIYFLLNSEFYSLPADYLLEKFYESKTMKNLKRKKKTIIVRCQKIQKLPQKIINDLIHISCRHHNQVFLITEDNLQQIFQKVPLSQKNHMIVLNNSGSLFSYNKKLTTLLDSSGPTLTNFKVHMKELLKKLEPWKSTCSFKIVEQFNQMILKFPRNIVSKILIEQVEREIFNINEVTKYQISLKKVENEDERILRISPLAFSTQFYVKTIVSMDSSASNQPFIFYFQCQNCSLNKYNQYKKKGLIFNNFMIDDRDYWDSISYDSLSNFLRCLEDSSSFEYQMNLQQPMETLARSNIN